MHEASEEGMWLDKMFAQEDQHADNRNTSPKSDSYRVYQTRMKALVNPHCLGVKSMPHCLMAANDKVELVSTIGVLLARKSLYIP